MKTIKKNLFFNGFILPPLILLTVTLGFIGCGTLKSISERFDNRMGEAIRSMDNAIATLSQQSADWQVVVANLEKEVSKDIQSTIRTEITDLTRNAVLSTGSEVRCNAEFLRIKVRRELIDIRNEMAETLNAILEKKSLKRYQVPLISKEPIRPFICDIVPSAVDMSLDDVRRLKVDIYGFDLRSFPITASYKTYGAYKGKASSGKVDFHTEMNKRYQTAIIAQPLSRNWLRENVVTNSFELFNPLKLFEHDISSAISIISDFHAVLDLTGSGANLPPNAKEILLSWDNKIQCEIPILIHEKVLECNTWDSTFVLQPLTFIPIAVVNSEYGGHPDTEFKGNGPCIEFSMYLSIDPSRKILNATVFMDAWECPDDFSKIHKDYTQAIETKTFPIAKLSDPDMIMVGFNLEPSLSDRYIDSNENPDLRYYSSTAPAYKIEFTGDTDGDEAGSRTGAVISFNPIKIKVQKCGYK